MLKAKALRLVQDIKEPEIILNRLEAASPEEKQTEAKEPEGIEALIGKQQNIRIESYGEDEAVKDCITRLAVLLVREDRLLKGFIRRLRTQYVEHQKAFSFSIAAWNEEDQKKLREIFSEELCGVVDSVDVTSDPQIISGNLVFSPEARNFISGQYMEIGVYEAIKEVMNEIAESYKISWKVYRNVVVSTLTGISKNEFDVVIECNGMFYVVEVKSGENFKAWGDLVEAGREYKVVPGRLLLVDSWLSDEKAGRIEELCQYYVSNLENDTLREKVFSMITSDLKNEEA